ncbi:hypothetical protein [Halalkalibacter okhensis]|uniref:hypothetical protein n=1 Tax=Halalkalibacter okhensis TaxID=333138 RepID=UPI000A7C2BC8|nr:hypothetical protein [Halalkalibacter okhensis]
MEIIIMFIMFYFVLILAFIVFFKNRVGPNKRKIEDLQAKVAKLEKENEELKQK